MNSLEMNGDLMIDQAQKILGMMGLARAQKKLGETIAPHAVLVLSDLIGQLQQGLSDLRDPADQPIGGGGGDGPSPDERRTLHREAEGTTGGPAPPATEAAQPEQSAHPDDEDEPYASIEVICAEDPVDEPAEETKADAEAAAQEPAQPACAAAPAPSGDDSFTVHHIACAKTSPSQVGIIGSSIDDDGHRRSIALNLDHPLALAFVGVCGAGKSYLMALLAELYVLLIRNLSDLRHARCAIILSYHPSTKLGLEMMAAAQPNTNPAEVAALARYGAIPQGIKDMLVLTIKGRVDELRALYHNARVHPLVFSCEDLGNQGLRILLGLHQKHSPLYAREVSAFLRKLWARKGKDGRRRKLLFSEIVDAAQTSDLSDDVRDILLRRLEIARPWIDDTCSIRSYKKRGRVIQVDIRDEWLAEEEAMMLFALATEALVLREEEDGKERIPTVVIYDEAFKFTGWAIVRKQMDTIVRQRRHLNAAILLGCQDPQPLPKTIMANLDGLGIFRHQSEDWLKYMGRHIDAIKKLKTEDCAQLEDGEFWLWVAAWHTPEQEGPTEAEPLVLDSTSLLKVSGRPRVSQHGGETLSAVSGP